MKTGTSSLNPYAASYIPLSRRGLPDNSKGYELAKDSRSGNEAAWTGSHPWDTSEGQYQKAYQNYSAVGSDNFKIASDSKWKGNSVYGSSSQNPNQVADKQTLDEEYDMHLAYLQMSFPGISDESLSDVYMANKGDLDSTIEMLNQLELYTGDFSENLPDTLDIGDVSESRASGESASLKLMKVAAEVGGSSSATVDPNYVN